VTAVLRRASGTAHRLAVDDWTAPATGCERDLLARVGTPVLDVGCGPGRLVEALAERGAAALGVDASPAAVDQALDRGGSVLCRSVFEPIPGEGRWRTVLLFDGNIGIGGDPVRLLQRLADLVHPSGQVLVEVDPPGSATEVGHARVELDGASGPWFPWAWVDAGALSGFAAYAGLTVAGWLHPAGRWIARLERGRR
jgi:SAM-dependent methyltransferase